MDTLVPGFCNSLKIERLDLALDFDTELSVVVRDVDISYKQDEVEYTHRGGETTGVKVGKSTEKITVYDRRRVTKGNDKFVRIEIQLKGKKLPTRRVNDLPEAIMDPMHVWFGGVSLQRATVLDDFGIRSDTARIKVLLDEEGYMRVRKKLNRDGNFARDYQKRLQVTLWPEQPSEAFSRLIAGYFQ
jgi:hypothetical protein